MISALNLQSLAQFSAEQILNCAVEGIGIALLAWMLLRALGRRNSGTRFAVWFTALLAIAVLPLFGRWAASSTGAGQRSGITLPGSWALYLFAAWALIAGAGLTRVGIGLWQLRRLRRSCVPIDVGALDPMLRKTVEEGRGSRPVAVCVSHGVGVPAAIGFVKPLVILPRWTMQEISVAELNSILLHELAHLRRWDDWTNLVQRVLGALLFFHPPVWWIEKKLALEREMACDDLVLAQAASPRAYAECLVSLAEKSLLRRGLTMAQAAVDRLRHVSLRVSQILDADRPRTTRVWRPAPVLLAGVSLICLMMFSNRLRLVSFENATMTVAASPSVENAAAPGRFEASPLSRMGAHVVPAALAIKAEDNISGPVVAKTAVQNSFKATRKPGVIPASAGQRRAKAPTVVRTSQASDAAVPQILFLVMQTDIVQDRQYGASGAVVWDLCVWQVIVVGPVQKQNTMEAGIIAKSI
jgi:beta-lactamase regulating signal transducer with metallopeptidase domain